MTGIRTWLALFIEYALLGVALGCFGMYTFESVEARRFQAEQTAAFEEAARAQLPPAHVRAGGLVGMLDVPRLKLTTPVVAVMAYLLFDERLVGIQIVGMLLAAFGVALANETQR